jgi:hypothetical protein
VHPAILAYLFDKRTTGFVTAGGFTERKLGFARAALLVEVLLLIQERHAYVTPGLEADLA